MRYVAVLAALGLGSAVLLVNSDAFAQGPHGAFMERLKAADKNADGMLSRDEAASLPRLSQHFDAIDADHNGFITFEELRAFHGQRHGHHGHGLKKLDKDGDGRISREEAAGAPRLAARFDQVDANHDGFLTREELRAAHRAMREAHWKRMDADGDGRISLAEAQANAPRIAAHFEQLDANHDGFVTREELREAFKARHGKHHRAGQ